MDYKKLKAFLKAEQKDYEAGKGASSKPRYCYTGKDYHTLLIGTGGAFYVMWDHERNLIGYDGEVVDDSRMADFFTKKEGIEPIAALKPTMHLYEVPAYKGPSSLYRKLVEVPAKIPLTEGMGYVTYSEGEERKVVWVARRFLDIVEPDAGSLQSFTNAGQPDSCGTYKIELVEPLLVRVKQSNSYFEVGKGQVHYWTTVAYMGVLNLGYSHLEGIGEEEIPEGVEA